MTVSPSNALGDSHPAILCLECGYDLRRIDSPRCPECGSDTSESRRYSASVGMRPRFEGKTNRLNLGLIFVPAAFSVLGLIAARLFWLSPITACFYYATAFSAFSGLVLAPVLALATMPWRSQYVDARRFGLGWRVATTLFLWPALPLTWLGLAMYWGLLG